jgi:hypothetical protein
MHHSGRYETVNETLVTFQPGGEEPWIECYLLRRVMRIICERFNLFVMLEWHFSQVRKAAVSAKMGAHQLAETT